MGRKKKTVKNISDLEKVDLPNEKQLEPHLDPFEIQPEIPTHAKLPEDAILLTPGGEMTDPLKKSASKMTDAEIKKSTKLPYSVLTHDAQPPVLDPHTPSLDRQDLDAQKMQIKKGIGEIVERFIDGDSKLLMAMADFVNTPGHVIPSIVQGKINLSIVLMRSR